MENSKGTRRVRKPKLKNRWVVIILDPEGGDWSPWSVVAEDIGEAVKIAVDDWKDWQTDPTDPNPTPPEKPHIFKVYGNSWIDEIAWGADYGEGLGSYDMTQLDNP